MMRWRSLCAPLGKTQVHFESPAQGDVNRQLLSWAKRFSSSSALRTVCPVMPFLVALVHKEAWRILVVAARGLREIRGKEWNMLAEVGKHSLVGAPSGNCVSWLCLA